MDEEYAALIRKAVESVVYEEARKLIEVGRIIEAGFIGYKFVTMPDDATKEEVRSARMTFFAGADYLWSRVLHAMSGEVNVELIDLVSREIAQFEEQIRKEAGK